MKTLRLNLPITISLIIGVYSLYVFTVYHVVLASSTSNFSQAITAGTLSVDIVDASYASVATPAVAMDSVTFDYVCQPSTGVFGTATEQVYVKNPDAADGGWTVSIAGAQTTSVWDGAASDFDFNDSGGSGCTDGADADSVGGQMTVDPTSATLAVGACVSCATSNITLGSSAAFVEGTTNSITLLDAAASSSDIGDWTLQGIDISQTIPAEQPVATDYDINLVVSIASK